MKKVLKAFYILMIALIVFLGGLLISKGLTGSQAIHVVNNQEGTAL